MSLRLLFVDDDPNVLSGLRRTLRSMRKEWEIRFATSGREALDALEASACDVVVSDMMMPGMDGAELLNEVKSRFPGSVRLILSGHSDQDRTVKAIPATHRFLAKPCDVEELKEAIASTCALRDLLADPELKRLVGSLDKVPSVPSLYAAVTEELAKPHSSLDRVGELISMDIGMSAKILQIVNSSYFGLSRPMSDVRRAVAYLGVEVINALVLSSQVFSAFEGRPVPGFSIDGLWQHSIRTARRAKELARTRGLETAITDDAFLAGMLHAAGLLLLAGNLPDRFSEALARARQDDSSTSDAERAVLGANHAEVGAYLLSLWGLPQGVVEAVAYHLRPSECPVRRFGALAAVHLANTLDDEGGVATGELDETFVEQLEIDGQLEEIRAICEDAGAESPE